MKRNLWPYAITAYFVLFITGVITWVVFAVHHEDQLVRPDYYEHEMRFQQQIDRAARTAALGSGVQVTYQLAEQTLRLTLPGQETSGGTVRLYRPSDAKLDRSVKLELDARGSQTIDVAGLEPGLWKVRLSWSTDGNEYYFDQPVILAAR